MPALEPRNAFNYMALSIPVAAILLAFAGLAVSIRRIVRGNERPIDIVVAAGTLAFTVTFIVHIVFGYQYHLAFGWMTSAYPRYYLPLAALVPLAGLSLLAAIRQPRTRVLLIGFLIASPVVFRLLGAPLG
jgi:amino acid permease